MTPGFGVLQVRIQAAHGRRLDATTWHALAPARPFAVFLKRLRETSANHWLGTLSTAVTPHELEGRLRQAFRHHVAEVASWAPDDWRPAILWTARLHDLPMVHRLLSGEAVPGWVGHDLAWAGQGGGLPFLGDQALMRAAREGSSLLMAWLAHWRTLLPPGEGEGVEELVRHLLRHREAMAVAPDVVSALALRQGLEAWLVLRFRRGVGRPVVIFLHLALAALELERLRGGLVQRLLWESGGVG